MKLNKMQHLIFFCRGIQFPTIQLSQAGLGTLESADFRLAIHRSAAPTATASTSSGTRFSAFKQILLSSTQARTGKRVSSSKSFLQPPELENTERPPAVLREWSGARTGTAPAAGQPVRQHGGLLPAAALPPGLCPPRHQGGSNLHVRTKFPGNAFDIE